MWSVNGGQHFGIALLQISTPIRLSKYTQFALNPSQLVRPTTVQSESLIGYQVLSEHNWLVIFCLYINYLLFLYACFIRIYWFGLAAAKMFLNYLFVNTNIGME